MTSSTSNKPLVSIIVSIYNTEKYLDKCINSLINQTYKNLEIILVNDGSSDSSLAICNRYAKTDKRIIVVDKENGGAAQARNLAISKSNGQYISFVDSDDYVANKFIELLVDNIDRAQADICACNYYKVYDNGNRIKNQHRRPTTIQLTNLDGVRDVLLENSILETMLWNKLFKTELFTKNAIKMPEGEIYEDTRTLYRLLYYSNKIYYFDEPLYYYLQRPGSVMNHGVKLENLKLLTAIATETGDWLNSKTKAFENEIQAYKITGLINSLNYMIDGNKIYNDIWKANRRDLLSNLPKILFNPLISNRRKYLCLFTIIGKFPYKVIRKKYKSNIIAKEHKDVK